MGHGVMTLMAIIALLSFIICIYFLIKGIRTKNKKTILISTIAILLTASLSLKIDLKNIRNLFSKELSRLKPKTNNEIYTVIFKLSADSCVTVINTVDQVMPKIDCCVWLEFTTCSEELKKIISKLPYRVSKYALRDSAIYNPSSSPKPAWWLPVKLGDSLFKYHHVFDSFSEITLLINKDSTRVFCCDRAE